MSRSRIHRASISRRTLAAAAGVAVVAGALSLSAAPAQAVSAGLVISEVYGGGGNAGATFANDFIELHNPTGAAISVAGMSVQYRSATGTAAQITPLTGAVPAGGHYLVQEAAGATPTAALPAPDATGTIAMSGSNGVVLLVPNSTAFTTTGDLAGSAGLIDMVGFGTTPTSYETARTGVALTNSTAAARTGSDTDNNADDFSELAPAPQNTGGVAPPAPEEFAGSIAEIQGADTGTSPHVGDIATTTGVVTATYPSGGFNGFYLQSPGTGGASDDTAGASDAIFVYGSAATATVARGDHVEVVGLVKEFSGTTEIETDSATDVTQLTEPVIAPTALATTLPATEAAREAHEGELIAPAGPFTVTNTYATNQYAEIGLAGGTTPLIQPTDVADAQDTAAIAAVIADNAARAITLDDGASLNFFSAANQGIALPWLSTTNPIRVGAPTTFTGPVILEFRNGIWKFQPTSRVIDEGASTASFLNTRTAAPAQVGGDLRLATFNVLNYFNTTGTAFVAAGGSCTFYNDRTGDPVTDNSCNPDGPRGAAEDEDLARQQAKIVAAINALDADIVSLEEIENSVKLIGESDRDDALSALVGALNADAGSSVWGFAASPSAADLPPLADQDVIRTAFIYKPARVDLVGASQVLLGSAAFASAREPLAQAFKPSGADDASAFAVIVNHFKSKGSGTPDPDGQGNSTVDRVAQAQALSTFADQFAAARGTQSVFLTGDFNSYTLEDPLQVLYADGYTQLESDTAGESTYSFSGLSGSLDHVLANPGALAMVAGVDIWSINSGESVAFEYSRHNYNVTDFYEPNPYRASDHDPELVGIDVPGFPVDPPDPVPTSVSATVGPMTHGADGSVSVSLTPAAATGTVTVLDGDLVLGESTLSAGAALVTIPGTALEPGSHDLTVRYAGDATYAPSSGTLRVEVASDQLAARLEAVHHPGRVTAGKTRVTVMIRVWAHGVRPTGLVEIELPGGVREVVELRHGRARLRLSAFASPGNKALVITYTGDGRVRAASITHLITVAPNRK